MGVRRGVLKSSFGSSGYTLFMDSSHEWLNKKIKKTKYTMKKIFLENLTFTNFNYVLLQCPQLIVRVELIRV